MELGDGLDVISDDLGDVEDIVYDEDEDDYEDEEDDEDDEEECYATTCPECEEEILSLIHILRPTRRSTRWATRWKRS